MRWGLGAYGVNPDKDRDALCMVFNLSRSSVGICVTSGLSVGVMRSGRKVFSVNFQAGITSSMCLIESGRWGLVSGLHSRGGRAWRAIASSDASRRAEIMRVDKTSPALLTHCRDVSGVSSVEEVSNARAAISLW